LRSSTKIRVGLLGQARCGPSPRTIHPVAELEVGFAANKGLPRAYFANENNAPESIWFVAKLLTEQVHGSDS
jgi:hypothetical protein